MENVRKNAGAGALDGIKVLDFGRMAAAPYCAMMLANMGAEINPGIVYASISGFGQTGALAQRAAFDPIAQAMSGMMSVTGFLDGERVRCGASIADIMAGQNAAYAILAALLYREKSGKGQWIDIALADSCISALSSVNQIYLTTGEVPKPLGCGFEASAPGNSYKTCDGSVVLLAGRNSEWQRLAEALGRRDWLENDAFRDVPDRVKNRRQLDAEINRETQKYTTEELLKRLLEARLPAGEVLDVKQVAGHPHFKDTRNMFVEVEHPAAGTMRVTNLPIHMSETQPHMYRCAPLLGQDNGEVLSALGYSAEEIAELKDTGVI